MMGWALAVAGFGGAGLVAAAEGGREDRGGETPPRLTLSIPGATGTTRPLDMVLIREGSYWMGCSTDERGRVGREWPVHRVTLTRPFYLGGYEVTQGQWKAVMGTNPAEAGGLGVGEDHPAHQVTWTDCQSFLARLNSLGLGAFRLPTEAEWEYACRAGSTNRFWFGDALECSDEREYCAVLDRHFWWGGNNGKRGYPVGCKPVGLKAPNPWGLYDMHGNVWEWCSDGWQPPSPSGPRTDPQGPAQATHRVMRGGAWESHALHQRAADRSPMGADDREYGRLIGLRLVREVP